MTINQILNATSMLQKLVTLPLPPKKAYQVYRTIKHVDEVREFVVSEEKKLIEQYEASIGGDGTLTFASDEQCAAFAQQRATLLSCEIEFEELELGFDELGSAQFTALEMMALDGVIKFIE